MFGTRAIQHIYLDRTIRMRQCYYCNQSIATALYLQVHKAWACVECYVANYVHKPGASTESNCPEQCNHTHQDGGQEPLTNSQARSTTRSLVSTELVHAS
jgi:hypothetical protein